jgi:hypothetical protein
MKLMVLQLAIYILGLSLMLAVLVVVILQQRRERDG